MSDSFDTAVQGAEAAAAEGRQQDEARATVRKARSEAQTAALDQRLDDLKAAITAKEAALAAHGFALSVHTYERRRSRALLLTGGAQRIAIRIADPERYAMCAYTDGAQPGAGELQPEAAADCATPSDVMTTLGEWVVQYGAPA